MLLWSRADGCRKVYSQASSLAQRIDQSYCDHPGKWLAQLQSYKPHYDYLTNLTLKAAIFTAMQVTELGWCESARTSVIAATLTANIAVLKLVTKQADGVVMSDPSKAALAKSAVLSYKMLKQHQVLDPLWLNAISNSIPSSQSKAYPVDLHGSIVYNAYRFARPLCRQNSIKQLSVLQVLRQMYLESNHFANAILTDNAGRWCYRLNHGALVMLQNNRLAIIMHHMDGGGYLAFLFPAQTITPKGRFVLIASKHIANSQPCYLCEEPRLYSQLWETPLQRYTVEKEFEMTGIDIPQGDLFVPPTMLDELMGHLFDQPDLNKVSQLINSSTQLTQLLKETASQAASKDIKITDTKHALAMLGLNRIGPLLTQGALADIVTGYRFPGYCQVQSRQQCFIQALIYYGQFNDLIAVEELTMYASFWIAPLYISTTLQTSACRLHKQKTIAVEDAFALEKLFDQDLTETHQKQVLDIARAWQLPKLCLELFRQLNKADSTIKPAKRVAHGLAAIRLATLHCQTVFNQVDVNSPFLQQKLIQNLDVLRISLPEYLAHQDKFLLEYSPYTPLV
jgi:hypothetical protein